MKTLCGRGPARGTQITFVINEGEYLTICELSLLNKILNQKYFSHRQLYILLVIFIFFCVWFTNFYLFCVLPVCIQQFKWLGFRIYSTSLDIPWYRCSSTHTQPCVSAEWKLSCRAGCIHII